MADTIAVLNAGSSSIKFALFVAAGAEPQLLLRGQIEELHAQPRFRAENAAGETIGEHIWDPGKALSQPDSVRYIVDFLCGHDRHHRLAAIGHRVVHGGADYVDAVRIDADVLERLDKLVPLAPLHQPHNLAPIRYLEERLPGLPQVACFDTAFHHTQPELARTYALPSALTEQGVRRYGFHGLSYEYIAGVLPSLDAKAAAGAAVVAHLGSGASMCALRAGRSVASTMGFTVVDGLPMATRSGTLDPGVVLYLIDELKMSTRQVETLIYRKSGWLGVSGSSSDMRELIGSSEPRARFAVELFVYRIQRELGSLMAALGGLDALIFTGGIGENTAAIRASVCEGVAWAGLALDRVANDNGGPRVSAPGSRIAAWVIPTNEELMIARHTRTVLG